MAEYKIENYLGNGNGTDKRLDVNPNLNQLPSSVSALDTKGYLNGRVSASSSTSTIGTSSGNTSPTLEWFKQFGGGVTVEPTGNIFLTGSVDTIGNIFITGIPPELSLFPNRGFITNLDSSGTQKWTQKLDNSYLYGPSVAVVDSADNIYTMGGINNTQLYVTKYNSSGNNLWNKYFSVSNNENIISANSAVVDSAGNLYIAGHTDGVTIPDIYVTEFDSSGNQKWITKFGSTATLSMDPDYVNSIAVDNAGNIYIAGKTYGNLENSMGLGDSKLGGNDAFIAKLSNSGERLWTKQFGTVNEDVGNGVAVDSAGHVYVVGATYVLNTPSTANPFIYKFDSNGNQLWDNNNFGAPFPKADYANGVTVDSAGNVYVTGSTTGNLEGTNAGGYDAFFTMFDSSGTQQWTKQFGSSKNDIGTGIVINASGNIYITGHTDDSIYDEGFLAKFSHSAPPQTITNTDILWRNSATGEDVVWFMNGSTITSPKDIFPVTDQNWKEVGTGDFNGDGNTDILWRNSATGLLTVWSKDIINSPSSEYILYNGNPVVPDPDWNVAGTGDFNHDGKTDILWHNSKTGEDVVWFMNGSNLSSWQELIEPIHTLDWNIVGTGDFNKDGNTDILWRNSKTGEDVVWFMNGSTFLAWQDLQTITPTLNWNIVGTGDFNGDGNTDIVWRDSSTGKYVIWFMNGIKMSSWEYISYKGDSVAPDQNWQVLDT